MKTNASVSRCVLTLVITACAGLLAGLCAPPALAQTPESLREVQLSANSLDRSAPEPAWLIPISVAEDRRPGTALRILLSDTQINIAGKVPETYFRRVVQAHTPDATREIGQVTIPFVPAYQSVRLHRLNLLRNGQVIDKRGSTSLRFLQREAGLESGIYTGAITIAGLIEDVRPGDALDISYTIAGRNPVYGDKFSSVLAWALGAPILQRRLVLHSPREREIAHRFIGPEHLTRPRVDTWHEGPLRQLVVRQDDLPSFRPEAGVPAAYEPFLWLQLTEYRDWSEVARWGAGLFAEPAPLLAPELAATVSRLKALPDTQAKVREALRFTQGEIRYFSIAFGESSHRPAAPAAVMQRRYGDCKDKSLMLVALLRAAGVNARPVLVSTSHGRKLQAWLPGPDLFDHAIVAVEVDGRDHFLDPTRAPQWAGLEHMGQIHEASFVLPLDAAARTLVQINTPNLPELMRASVAEEIRLTDFAAPASLEIRSRWSGVAAETLREGIFSRAPAEMTRATLANVRLRYPGAESEGEPVVDYDRLRNVLHVTEKYRVKDLVRKVRDDWVLGIVPANVLSALRGATTEPGTRRAPLVLAPLPVRVQYSYRAVLPEEVSAADDPVRFVSDNRYFNIGAGRRFKANVAEGEISLESKVPEIPAADAPDYAKTWREAMDSAVRPVFIAHSLLTRSGTEPVAQGTEEALTRFARSNRVRMEAELTSMTRVIDERKLPGGDLASVHELRAHHLAALGRYDDALADIAQAQRLSPSSGQPLLARASIVRRRGDFARALADYAQALALGADPAPVAEGRGFVYLYQGKYVEAAAEFRRGHATLKDTERQVWHLIWGINALARAKRPLPADWKALADKEKNGAWPRPILKLLLGEIKPDDLVQSTQGRRDDERYLMLCEAYYQIGVHLLARDDRAGARSYFEKSLATGVLNYTEYEASGHELARLKSAKP